MIVRGKQVRAYLPDMTGLEVLRQIRETSPEVDVLVVTAAREAETVRRALRGGIVHYLMKPFTYEDLRARLEHYETTHRGSPPRPPPTRRTWTACSASGPAPRHRSICRRA
jgi:DNA-binding response OmpR family regulator